MAGVVALLAGCGDTPWNHPYPAAQHGENILYGAFAERPKHLDPAVAYSRPSQSRSSGPRTRKCGFSSDSLV